MLALKKDVLNTCVANSRHFSKERESIHWPKYTQTNDRMTDREANRRNGSGCPSNKLYVSRFLDNNNDSKFKAIIEDVLNEFRRTRMFEYHVVLLSLLLELLCANLFGSWLKRSVSWYYDKYFAQKYIFSIPQTMYTQCTTQFKNYLRSYISTTTVRI